MEQRQGHKKLKKWSKRFATGILGCILLLLLSVPTAARNTPEIPILDNQPLEVPQSQPTVTPAITSGLTDPQEFAAFTNDFFHKQLSKSKIPGAVISVVKDGKVFFSKGYGYANLEKKIPVDAERTVFRVASLSKLFTSTAVMQLYERNLIDIHSDVNEYLEGWQLENPYSEPVTPARMMMHTDGTTQRLIGLGARTEAQMKPLAQYLPEYMPPINYLPGKFYSYSNHSIALAGYLVEQVAGVPFVEYIDQNILQPLAMQRSSFQQPPPPELADDFAVGYRVAGGQSEPVPYLYLNIAPAAALETTATDMAHFMLAHLQQGRYQNAQILQPETARLMHQTHYQIHPQLPGTSYGFRERLVNNRRAIGHLGSLRGYSSSLTLISEEGIGIFIAANSFNNLHGQYIAQFFDRYFPKPTESLATPQLSQQQLARYTGTYRDMEYPRATMAKIVGVFQHTKITTQPDGTLLAQTPNLFFRGVDSTKLIPTEEPRLFRRQSDGDFTFFVEDASGNITHVSNPLYPKIGTYQRVHWYETIGVHLGLLAFCVLFFLTATIAGIIRPLVRALQGEALCPPKLTAARTIAGLIGLLNLIFLVGLPLYLWRWGAWKLVYGVPPVAVGFFCLPILTTLLSLLLLILMLIVWRRPVWSLGARSHYSLVTLAAIAFIPLLMYWNLLGFQF
ncbi:MAG: serine hydrolase [Cyanophyceae cyanobacterium]